MKPMCCFPCSIISLYILHFKSCTMNTTAATATSTTTTTTTNNNNDNVLFRYLYSYYFLVIFLNLIYGLLLLSLCHLVTFIVPCPPIHFTGGPARVPPDHCRPPGHRSGAGSS